ncbi:MAG: hypothetical protein IT495_02110 [Gammaproteobacteria bacterium]|nr:hypothetical protein [Gammaproteobacteria bacterium]
MHAVYARGELVDAQPIHIYITGDGSPWLHGIRIARDPTPRHDIVVDLMLRDPAPSLLIGRPCYHGLARTRACEPRVWTAGRYSEPVVHSMAVAIRAALEAFPHSPAVLIGYSGGGALAMLIAARVPAIGTVVTVAANLDVAAWTRLHGYAPLTGSLDPAREPPLAPRIRQFHFAGGRDTVSPVKLNYDTVFRQSNYHLTVIPGFDHRCCWVERWPALIASAGLAP